MKKFFVMAVVFCFGIISAYAHGKARNFGSLHRKVRTTGDSIRRGFYVLRTENLKVTATYIFMDDGGSGHSGYTPFIRIQDGNETFEFTAFANLEACWTSEVSKWIGQEKVSDSVKALRLNRLYRKVENELKTVAIK
jgi:hypothetical protein